MVASVTEQHCCELDGDQYWFRTPTVYDLPKMRRVLGRQGLRMPQPQELQVAALAGIVALGEMAGDPVEAARQKGVMEEWYRLIEPTKEDDVDEPDFELRAAEVARLESERLGELAKIYPEVAAIEANLLRHWPVYSELCADKTYWDDVSNIEVVRLLLVRIGSGAALAGPDGMLPEETFQCLPRAHRLPLARFATQLLVPTEHEEKN